MIKGIGIDVVEMGRLSEVVERWGNRFLEKVFTEGELAYARSKKFPMNHIAGRFAAKEAVAKALATGWSGAFRWKDVEVTNDLSGKPSILLHGNLQRMLAGSRVLISISHSESVIVASAVIETDRSG
jgi:holo-[acyl-carrier protein] synthase